MSIYPSCFTHAIDARDCRELGECYRQHLGLRYLEEDEPPTDGSPDEADWLVLLDGDGDRVLTIAEKRDTTPPSWPSEEVPMQMHMDFKVPSVEDLERHRERAETLGARLLYDRSKDEGEPLHVLADPAGHPFCLLSNRADDVHFLDESALTHPSRLERLESARRGYGCDMATSALVRPRNDKWIAGVCAGLANRFGLPTGLVRLAFVVFGLVGAGEIAYIVLWILIPKAESS